MVTESAGPLILVSFVFLIGAAFILYCARGHKKESSDDLEL